MPILFIDDDNTGRAVAVHNLRRAGLEVDDARDGAEGLQRFDPQRHEVVVTDLKMPGVDGMTLLRTVRERAPQVPVVVITAFGSVDLAVDAMRQGAWDFLEKPFSRDRLELTLLRALETSRLRADNRRLRSGVERPIVAASQAMQGVLELADRVAPSTAGVLITGESGVGKELVARRIHARSERAAGPFVAVNCASVPGELLESELFGHTRGAFTGATQAREGRFRRASGGTLFLDEIAELPLALQGKLLRVLQEGLVDVVGADEPIAVDARIVVATNQVLEERVSEGRFREDLFYRLDVIQVHLPPLRERREDIVPLAEAFLAELAPGRRLRLPAQVAEALARRGWHGNVRELRNVCERLAILASGGEVALEHLPPERFTVASDRWLELLPEGLSLGEIEEQVVRHVLDRCSWNVSEAARRLGVPRHILAYRLEKHGIERGG